MDFLAVLERRVCQRLAISSVALVTVSAAMALTGCVDPSDYGSCVEKAESSSRYKEFCAPAPSDGVCPDYEDVVADAMAHSELDQGNCGAEGIEMRKVVCGPENDGVEEAQAECCYVAKVDTQRADEGCAVGRPFLVAGRARVAPTSTTGALGWCEGISPQVPEDPGLRQALADHWTQAAQAEHASVAAFARFALQLMQLGAPPELLSETQAAMADELHHARMCFGLAAQYADAARAPGSLDMDQALEDMSVESIVACAIHEGCIGETLAALDAAAGLARVDDPEVAAVLETIREDESRHAELAWGFVAWVLDARPELRPFVARTFDEALGGERPQLALPMEDRLAHHGVIVGSRRARLHDAARAGMLRRCVSALLGDALTTDARPEVMA